MWNGRRETKGKEYTELNKNPRNAKSVSVHASKLIGGCHLTARCLGYDCMCTWVHVYVGSFGCRVGVITSLHHTNERAVQQQVSCAVHMARTDGQCIVTRDYQVRAEEVIGMGRWGWFGVGKIFRER